jgi:hypothetical protein
MQSIFGIFGIVLILIWIKWIYTLMRFLKYGESYLRLNHFPLFLGDKMDVTLQTFKTIPGLTTMDAILRCVEEKYEIRGTGDNRTSKVVSYQIYAEDIKINQAHIYQAGQLQLPLTFVLPLDKEFETCLSCRPAKYWELEIKAKTPGIDFLAHFLLPVYAKP